MGLGFLAEDRSRSINLDEEQPTWSEEVKLPRADNGTSGPAFQQPRGINRRRSARTPPSFRGQSEERVHRVAILRDTSNLFSVDKFSGYDRVEGGGRANVGVQSTTGFDRCGSSKCCSGNPTTCSASTRLRFR